MNGLKNVKLINDFFETGGLGKYLVYSIWYLADGNFLNSSFKIGHEVQRIIFQPLSISFSASLTV